MSLRRLSPDQGFTLVEALVALGLIVIAAVALLQLFLQSTTLMRQAREAPVALAAVQSKIEQLRVLLWTFDAAGAAISDVASDTSREDPLPGGGTGLQSSPAHSLAENVDGFVDYLDMHGRALGGGGSAPGDMAYTRRWSVAVVDADSDLIALRACVWERAHLAGAPAVCLSTARARRP